MLVDNAGLGPSVGTGLRQRSGMSVVGDAPNGESAVRMVAALQPDVVVLDSALLGVAIGETVTRIRRESPLSKVVVFADVTTDADSWNADRVEECIYKDAKLNYLIGLIETLAFGLGKQVVLRLRREPESLQRARDFVLGALAGWATVGVADDAVLVVSELVTNAITHAKSACELRLFNTTPSVRIEVADRGGGRPDPRPPADPYLSGWTETPGSPGESSGRARQETVR
jgi:anti-sigma regulatory factor (Ser/Thr protein kinase)